MEVEYKIDKKYAEKCLQANKHNHITASYYLLLKEMIKRGEKSPADVRSPDYNPSLFEVKNIKVEQERDKLENASIQADELELKVLEANEIEERCTDHDINLDDEASTIRKKSKAEADDEEDQIE